MEINKHIYYIKPDSENLRSKVERYEQRPVKASALLCLGAERTVQKPIIKGSRFAACSTVAPLRCMPANRELALEQQRIEKIISDHLGSPIEVRATTGGLPVLSCKYDSFGNIIEQNGDFELPFRFAGGIWDEDTKLIRFGVRKFQIQMSIQYDSRNQRSCHYDPEVGRWTSVEPLGFAGSRNWYVYSADDPVGKIDLDGRAYKCYSNSRKTAHAYLCTDKKVCSGFGPKTWDSNWKIFFKSLWPFGGYNGKIYNDVFNDDLCTQVSNDDECMDKCLNRKFNSSRPKYHLFWNNCRDWVNDSYDSCVEECNPPDDSYWENDYLPDENYNFTPELGKRHYE